MKNLTLFVLILVSITFSTITTAQHLTVEGNQWNVRYFTSIVFYGVKSYTLHLEGDTLINGLNYKKIYRSDDSLQVNAYQTNRFIREENLGKVFLKVEDEEEFLLYDFSLELMDEFVVSIYGESDCTMRVTAIDTVTLNNGEQRKRLAIQSVDNPDWYITDYWVEGIGSTTSGLLNYYVQFCLTDYLQSFLCHFKNEELLYPSNPYSCFVVPTLELSPADPISVYPSPFKDQLWINIEGQEHIVKDYKIYDLNGKRVLSGELESTKNEVNTSILPKGMYLLTVLTVDGSTFTKRLVKL